jgi:hypothetical protein
METGLGEQTSCVRISVFHHIKYKVTGVLNFQLQSLPKINNALLSGSCSFSNKEAFDDKEMSENVLGKLLKFIRRSCKLHRGP